MATNFHCQLVTLMTRLVNTRNDWLDEGDVVRLRDELEETRSLFDQLLKTMYEEDSDA